MIPPLHIHTQVIQLLLYVIVYEHSSDATGGYV